MGRVKECKFMRLGTLDLRFAIPHTRVTSTPTRTM